MLRSMFDAVTNIPSIMQFFDDMFGEHSSQQIEKFAYHSSHVQNTVALNTFASSTYLMQSFFKNINQKIGQQILNVLEIPQTNQMFVVLFSHNDGSKFTFSKTNQLMVPVKTFVSYAYQFTQIELIMFVLYHFFNKHLLVNQYQHYAVGIVQNNTFDIMEHF